MTCIVGVIQEATVWMGADSAGVSGWDLAVRVDQKLFRKGAFLIGFTDSFRIGQVLRYHLDLPEHPDGMDAHEYMVTRFIPAARECLKTAGVAKKSNEQEEGGTFLVGYGGRLFAVHSDYQVAENDRSFAAVGCGAQIAIGAMEVTNGNLDPKERILVALRAAESWCAGVRGPFLVESLLPAPDVPALRAGKRIA